MFAATEEPDIRGYRSYGFGGLLGWWTLDGHSSPSDFGTGQVVARD